MKNGKVPTKRQKIAIAYAGLSFDKWLVSKVNGDVLTLVHRETGRAKEIYK